MELTSKYHPNWKNLKEYVKILMARNANQVLGNDLITPSEFVLCWTPDGAESPKQRSRDTGGTGQAISIAYDHGIPVINMKNPLWIERLEQIIGCEII